MGWASIGRRESCDASSLPRVVKSEFLKMLCQNRQIAKSSGDLADLPEPK